MDSSERDGTPRVSRFGDTVRRPAGWWTPAVQALLAHLAAVGFDRAPRPLGVEGGYELVSYVDGDHGAACWERIVTDDGVRAFGSLLRSYHDAVESFVPPGNARWKLPPLEAPDALVCHGDFAPWNIVWAGPEPVGIIDWEFARPRSRLDDLAWAAVWSVPLRSDEEAVDGWECWVAPPDRAVRLKLLVDAYGRSSPREVLDRAVVVLRRTFEDVRHLADLGMEPQRTWVADGSATANLARAQWSDDHREFGG